MCVSPPVPKSFTPVSCQTPGELSDSKSMCLVWFVFSVFSCWDGGDPRYEAIFRCTDVDLFCRGRTTGPEVLEQIYAALSNMCLKGGLLASEGQQNYTKLEKCIV